MACGPRRLPRGKATTGGASLTTQYSYSTSTDGGPTGSLAGTLASVTNPDGIVTTYTYYNSTGDTAPGQLYGAIASVTVGTGTADAATTYYQYDAAGNITEVTDPMGNITYYLYDAMNRLLQVTQPGQLDGNGDTVYPRTVYAYNAIGEETSMTSGLLVSDPNSSSIGLTSSQYAALGGHTTTYTYDGLGRVIEVVDGNSGDQQGVTQYQYDGNGNLVQESVLVSAQTVDGVVQDAWATTTYVYDANNNLTDVLSPPNASGYVEDTHYTYDNENNVLSMTTAYGTSEAETTSYTYDGRGDVLSMTDPDGGVTTYQYDAVGNLISETDPLDRTTTYQYDESGRLIEENQPAPNDPSGSLPGPVTIYQYNGEGQVLEEQTTAADGSMAVTSYQYDSLGDLTQTTLPSPTGQPGTIGPVSSAAYNLDGQMISQTDADGNTTSYSYYPDGLLETVTDPDGGTTSYVYDGDGNVIQQTQTDPGELGRPATSEVTTYTYDAMDRETSMTDPDGGVTQWTYDAGGQVQSYSVPAPNGPAGSTVVQDTYTYDLLGRLLTTTDAAGDVTTDAYDDNGNLASVTQTSAGGALSQTTTYGYNGNNQQTSEIDPDGVETVSTYDLDGELTSVTTASGTADAATTYYAYDNLGRVIAEFDTAAQLSSDGSPTADTTTYGYDAAGNQISVTDALGNTTTSTYNDLNQLVGTTDATGATTRYSYDADGNTQTVTDPDGNVTTYLYDSMNRVRAEITPLGEYTYQYDAYGNEIQQTDADNRVTQYAYNGLNELVQENWLASDGSIIQSTNYGYNADGLLTTAVDPNSAYTFSYNNLDELTGVDNEATVDGVNYETAGEVNIQLNYQYNGLGQRTSVSDNFGGSTTYGYNSTTGQLTSETLAANDQSTIVGFQYDAAGRVQMQTDSSSATGSATIQAAYQYNAEDQITSVSDTSTSASGTQTPLATYAYTYEANGWTHGHTGPDGEQIHSYNAAGELIGDQSSSNSTSYSYDANGNRDATGDVTGTDNLLMSDGTYNYTYDADGNRITATNIATGAVTTYTWNYANELVEAETVTSSGQETSDEKFTYDMFGRLIADSLDSTGSGTYVTTYTVYDTSSLPQPGQMADNVYADFSSTGSLETRYLAGPALDQVFANVAANGTTTWNLTDSQGSVRQVVDVDGNVLDTIDYDAYGNITSESNPSAASRFKYDGMAWDAALGLYLDHAREYDPADGIFISQDPMSFAAGQANLIEFVANGPTDGGDPTGLWSLSKWIWTGDGNASDYQYAQSNVSGNWFGSFQDAVNDQAQFEEGGPGSGQSNIGAAISYLGGNSGQAMASSFDARNQLYNELLPDYDPQRYSSAVNVEFYDSAKNLPIVGPASQLLWGDSVRPGESSRAIGNAATQAGAGFVARIVLTSGGLAHIAKYHFGLVKGKSVFYGCVDLTELINNANTAKAVYQKGGNVARTLDAGFNVGIDRATGGATSVYTVIHDSLGNLVTAFPGRP